MAVSCFLLQKKYHVNTCNNVSKMSVQLMIVVLWRTQLTGELTEFNLRAEAPGADGCNSTCWTWRVYNVCLGNKPFGNFSMLSAF